MAVKKLRIKSGENIWDAARRLGFTDAREVAALQRQIGSPRAGQTIRVNTRRVKEGAARGGEAFFAREGIAGQTTTAPPGTTIDPTPDTIAPGVTPDLVATDERSEALQAQADALFPNRGGMTAPEPEDAAIRRAQEMQNFFFPTGTPTSRENLLAGASRGQSAVAAQPGVDSARSSTLGMFGLEPIVDAFRSIEPVFRHAGSQVNNRLDIQDIQKQAVKAAQPRPASPASQAPNNFDLQRQSARMNIEAINYGVAPDTMTDAMGEMLGRPPELWRAWLTAAGYTETAQGVWKLEDAEDRNLDIASGGAGPRPGGSYRPSSFYPSRYSKSPNYNSYGNTFQNGYVDTLMSWRIKFA